MKRETHSDKGLKTIQLMNTKPSEWGLTEIIWKLERRMVPTQIQCPSCRGRGEVHVELNGERAVNQFDSSTQYYDWNQRQHEIRMLPKRRCNNCPPSRSWAGMGTGKVWDFQEREVWIGYVQWHKDTKFDSRFEGGIYQGNRVEETKAVCELCSKSIKTFDHLIPVTAKGEDGVIHGMWVGMDCAKKFFGVKNFKKDHFLHKGGK